MIGFLNAFDAWFKGYIEEQYPDENIDAFFKSFGYVELTTRTNKNSSQPIPVTINGTSDRDHVSLDDRFKIMTWHRLPGTVTKADDIEGNNYQFGFKKNPVQKTGITWVIVTRVELGEELIFNIFDAIPGMFTVDGYSVASIDNTSISLDADHERIYRTELGNTVYELHRFPWNLYVITFNLNYILNENCSYGSGVTV